MEVGDGRAEGSSAIGDGEQAANSLTPDADGMHVHIFESLKLEGLYVGDLCACLTLCDPMDCSPLGSSVHGILQARILEWVAISSSRGSSQLRDPTCVSCMSCIGRHILYH